jgi:RHS repeat-associated protein
MVKRETPEVSETTVWNGWQPIETYVGERLQSRRVYGERLDAMVRQEADLDGDGTIEIAHAPVFDSTGSVAMLVSDEGRVVERYSMEPYGKTRITVDATPPKIGQLRLANGEILLVPSEEVSEAAFRGALARGEVVLREGSNTSALNLEVRGRANDHSGQTLALLPATAPASGASVELVLATGSLVDLFGNGNSGIVKPFAWSAGDAMIEDTIAPKVMAVRVRAGVVEVEASEKLSTNAAGDGLRIDGDATTWTVSEDGATARLAAGLPAGTHTLDVTAALTDLAGNATTDTLRLSFPAERDAVLHVAPDPRQVTTSSVGNRFQFHGRDTDPATGFVYMRYRWFDPDLGRFISQDPMGYVDGPAAMAFAGNGPVNGGDPLGLYSVDFHFYVVFYMSLLATGSEETAFRIAFASQYVDDLALTSPTKGYTQRDEDGGFYFSKLRQFHFPASGGEAVVRATRNSAGLAQTLVNQALAANDDVQLGVALHTFADSFSHEDFSWQHSAVINARCRGTAASRVLEPVGHAHCGTEPDEPYRNPEKAADAAIAVYQQVARLQKLRDDAAGLISKRLRIDETALRKALLARFTAFIGGDAYRVRAWSISIAGEFGRATPEYDESVLEDPRGGRLGPGYRDAFLRAVGVQRAQADALGKKK